MTPTHVSVSAPLRRGWPEIAAVGIIALVFAAGHAILDRQAPFWDEYYHLLAGRSWAADGTFAVGDGWYGREAWFSALVGWVFRTFGEGLTQARMVSAVAQVAWVVTVFTWMRRETGRLSAWTAAVLLATSPVVLVNSVMVRFYAVNCVLVTLGAVALYAGTKPKVSRPRRFALLAGAATVAWISYEISALTRIWISGLLVWSAAAAVVGAARSRRRGLLLSSMGVAAAVLMAFLWTTGWFAETWEVYRAAPGWADPRAQDRRWYAELLRADYPTLFTLFPLAALLATMRNPRLGGLCLTAFVVALLLLSGAAPKSERYVLPMLSFFFVLWGLAVAELIPTLLDWSRRLVGRILPAEGLARTRRSIPPALVAGVVLFVLATNAGFTRARAWADGRLSSLDRPPPWATVSYDAWESLAADLRPLMDTVEVVVTSNTLQVLYHVGSYDYGIRPTVIGEVEPPEEFGVDPRDGRPAISRLESLQTVVERHESGLVFGERGRWEHPAEGFTPDVAEFVYARMEPVPIPGSTGLVAYRWGPVPDTARAPAGS